MKTPSFFFRIGVETNPSLGGKLNERQNEQHTTKNERRTAKKKLKTFSGFNPKIYNSLQHISNVSISKLSKLSKFSKLGIWLFYGGFHGKSRLFREIYHVSNRFAPREEIRI